MFLKEGEVLLKDTIIDSDARTRKQDKDIKNIFTRKPSLKKNASTASTTKVH